MRTLLATLIVSLSVSLSAQQATVEGTLEITDADYLNGASRTTYALNTGTERLDLRVGRAPNVRPGQRVLVRGARQGQVMQVASIESGPHSLAMVPRQIRLLVLLYGFSDRPVTWQASDFAHIFGDGHLVAFWEENASGMLDITGTVIGPYTIPSLSSQCDRYQWWTEAYYAALNAGFNPLDYEKILHVIPANACPWAGIAERGGRHAWTVFSDLFIAGHEVGHLLGLRHSGSLACFSPTVCQGYEYGDTHDIMGNISAVHTNATQKMALGWLSPETITASGTYRIAPMVGSGGPKALRIQQNGKDYYVEYRNGQGFDSFAAPGVLVHEGEVGLALQRDLDWGELNDTILDPGQSWTEGDFTVRTVSVSPSGADIEITLGAVPPPPPLEEVCGDGIDNDIDGLIDEGCTPPPPPDEVCGDGRDNDLDGLIDENPPCEQPPPPPPSPPPPPPPTEICGDGVDNDLDGLVDEGCVVEPPPPPADTEAPSLTLSAKRNGRSANVSIVASASDNVGVVSGSVSLDGKVIAALTSTVSLTVKVGSGAHTVTATVSDEAGNVATRSVQF